MEHLRELKPIRGVQTWATIGVFDGVHLGHQKLIKAMVAKAKQANSSTAVITFYPHPAVVLHDLPLPFYLTSPDEKAALLGSFGIDRVYTLEFTPEMAALSYQDFMQQIHDNLNLAQLWVGEGFALGKGRLGTTTALRDYGKSIGCELVVVPNLLDDTEKVSSSKIRKWMQDGEVGLIHQALGRPYTIKGTVIHGDARGRTLGFPTANLSIWEGQLLPQKGVYATLVELNGVRYKAVTNVGYRPTFEKNKFENRIETFIIGFSETIYNEPMSLSFIEWIRPEMKFTSIAALIAQIQNDTKTAEEKLAHVPQTSGLSA